MTKEELASLPAKIRIATEAGKAAAAACTDDGGSANLDRVVIPLRGLRASQIKGLPGEVYPASTYHPRGLHLSVPFAGIGNRRYVGVQAMYRSLKDQGVDCYVYYQLD
ncbi:hypothetical protein NJF44_10410 [Pseudomonas guariconensis]|uniref:hypothetical protein n=1 Tax=Pseudomonas TaxID=286 RepID=UPI002096B52A|nr:MULTISPECIES: hypothetical protein [Pseudomonas]MCO7640694.1 hypothetical protein [Pseudomonas sp. S 311-6]MCO7515768.1 hypothetical protein [Pseudomonas putida]MCO7566388.1 hypothetical protein [Pseudomonas mosselii]MCO7595001.1 hypothetical protein [Pseudomonas guariconensis]MCO7605640.1 hypothetical protein [Pseudomonas guariconensis]